MTKKKWAGLVNIPEGKIGDYEIKHKYYQGVLPTANVRTAMFRGDRIHNVELDKPTRFHSLSYGGGVWMTDLPIEQHQHDGDLKGFSGSVLVGGLGLGYAVNHLARKKGVRSITVVEISKEVIDLVWPHVRVPKRIETNIIHMDLLEYLERIRGTRMFHRAFYDIWQSDGLGTFFNTVIPLYKASFPTLTPYHITCWNETVMRSQLVWDLISKNQMTQLSKEFKIISKLRTNKLEDLCEITDDVYWDWSVPFFREYKKAIDEGDEPTTDDLLIRMREYAGQYGFKYYRDWMRIHLPDSATLYSS